MKKWSLLILSLLLVGANAFALSADEVSSGLSTAVAAGASGATSVIIKNQDGAEKIINRIVLRRADCVLAPGSDPCPPLAIVIEEPAE